MSGNTGGRGEGRSSDLVMVEREPTDEMLEAGEATFVPGYKGTPVSTPAEVYAAMIAAALQSVEGGVQGSIATKQATDETAASVLSEPPEAWADCETCGGEGAINRAVHVYENGCGFSHPDLEVVPCTDCMGTGGAIVDATSTYCDICGGDCSSANPPVFNCPLAKQESCPESAPRTETAVREILLHEALVEAAKALCKHTPLFIDGFGGARLYSEEVRDVWRKQAIAAAECVIRAYLDACTKSAPGFKASHNSGERDPVVMPDCPGADTKSDGGVEGHAGARPTVIACDTGAEKAATVAPEYGAGIKPGPSDTQLTKTPSADHDAGNLRGLAEPNHQQPRAVSQGWRTDLENAPHNVRLLLGWLDKITGEWCTDFAPASSGQRYENGYSSISHHGYATHWMPLPAPPSPENTPRDSSESTTGGAE